MDNKCTKCGLCVKVCYPPKSCITLGEDGPKFDLTRCNYCGHCLSVCPVDALEHPTLQRGELIGKVPDYDAALKFLRATRSTRFFKPERIERDKLIKLLDAGRYPQSGSNKQGVRYLVVESPEKLEEIRRVFCETADKAEGITEWRNGWVAGGVRTYRETGYDVITRGCTALIFALGSRSENTPRDHAFYSLLYMSVIAPTLGLGTCRDGFLEILACDEKLSQPLERALGLDEDRKIMAVMMAGVPDVKFRRLVERDPLDAQFI